MDTDAPMTIALLVQNWLEDSKDKLKKSTYRLYEHYALDILVPAIGQIPAAAFGEDELKAYLKSAQEEDCDKNRLTENTAATTESIIRAAYRYGIEKGLIPRSYFGSFQGKKRIKKPLEILRTRDIRRLISRLDYMEVQRRLEVCLPLYTGMENGEVCALKWKDIDMEGGRLYIHRKLQRLKAESGAKATYMECIEYGENECRNIRISGTLSGVLKDLVNTGQVQCRKEGYVLTDSDKYLDERTYQLHLKELSGMLNISRLGAKSLRDTFAVMCLRSGGDIYSVACLMGMALSSADVRYHDYLTVNDDFLAGL